MSKKLGFGIIIAVWIGIVLTNYTPGTFLTGWDNLHPEFDFGLNVKRSLFAVWQEYQGVGLLGGMGHAADLPRQLILWLLSVVVPTNMLRYAWTFAMLGLGTLGAYALLIKLSMNRWAALFGGLFYLTNLATVQMFHTPFEAFTTHFGFLPWLLSRFLSVLEAPTRKNLLVFTVLSLLSTTQGYVQTIFFVYVMILGTIALTRLIQEGSFAALKRAFVAFAIVFATNAFWLSPNLYFTATNVSVLQTAKINQMATEEVYLRNRAYGTIADTLTLKGFWFDTFDLDPQRDDTVPTLGFWREYAKKPWVRGILYGFVLIMGAGLVSVVRGKHTRLRWLLPVTILTVTMLTTATSPFSWVHDWLRGMFPLFHQVFRFPFTKWAIAAGLCFSLLFGVGLAQILTYLQNRRNIRIVALAVTIIFFAIISYPLFTGNLFYTPMKTVIPQEYRDLFSYFRTRPQGRIANLPQPTYWGWSYERWGYTGSGFLWYGLSQPILDRAFDPWSGYNENYYWEISRSIYSKDVAAFDAALNKYDVRYVLLDENLISPSHNRALFTEEIKAMLAAMPEVREIAQFGKLTVYERIGATQNFVSTKTDLPSVFPAYQWTDNDVAYRELGDYEIASPSERSRNDTWTYPFRSLFTKRSVDEREFDVKEILTRIDALVYDSTKSADLVAENVKPCGVNNSPLPPLSVRGGEGELPYLRFTSRAGRGCLSFALTNQAGPDTGLPHSEGYLAAVESRHISGRPLMLSVINQTAKHTELETYLPTTHNPQPTTSYFILPPLSSDGLGYNVYLTNDAIGKQETINDLSSIRVYRIPYDELVHLRSTSTQPQPQGPALSVETITHPNPSYYNVVLRSNEITNTETTLILSQSFNPGWTAWERITTFPYVRPLYDHVLVNNWANGWKLTTYNSQPTTIILFFWPQILQWLGFALLPLPFLWVWYTKRV